MLSHLLKTSALRQSYPGAKTSSCSISDSEKCSLVSSTSCSYSTSAGPPQLQLHYLLSICRRDSLQAYHSILLSSKLHTTLANMPKSRKGRKSLEEVQRKARRLAATDLWVSNRRNALAAIRQLQLQGVVNWRQANRHVNCSEMSTASFGAYSDRLLMYFFPFRSTKNYQEKIEEEKPKESETPWPRDCPLCQVSVCSLLCPYLRAANKRAEEQKHEEEQKREEARMRAERMEREAKWKYEEEVKRGEWQVVEKGRKAKAGKKVDRM
ncbi:hypothetical protein BT63DRAFT_264696 [Microthyrium microscopicum]|uniref:Uncharacterized protein n=1 Tax=Microthyrium microscopicum TaxID=703497 RepID=A0A6A6UBH4_9PEZI|nr:hypothetical protein BT63DRAFT_264696 [Microthyrium microscopicum]